MIDKELEKRLANLREYKTIANAVDTISVICATSPEKLIDKLTGYGWDEEEASEIKKVLNGDYEAIRSDLFMESVRKQSVI